MTKIAFLETSKKENFKKFKGEVILEYSKITSKWSNLLGEF